MKLIALTLLLSIRILVAGETEERIDFILKTLDSAQNHQEQLPSISKVFHKDAVIRSIILSEEGSGEWEKRCIGLSDFTFESKYYRDVYDSQPGKSFKTSRKLDSAAIAKDGKSAVIEVIATHSLTGEQANEVKLVTLETFYLSTGQDGLKIAALDSRLP